MKIEALLEKKVTEAVKQLYGKTPSPEQVQVQKTRIDFEGDFTVVVFPLLKLAKKAPEQTANEIGEFLKNELTEIAGFNVVKGFLNCTLTEQYWIDTVNEVLNSPHPGNKSQDEHSEEIVVEFSSPNTNKPLHLGHIRNNLLGESITRILKAAGHTVHKVQIVNDRGIHISKTMLAWQKWSNGETPETTGEKGDHFVGRYYVMFDKALKKQTEELVQKGYSKEEAATKAPLMQEARELLRKWENADEEVVTLWRQMNSWVYQGFDKTYRRLGISFDKNYYESETYKKGREVVLDTLQRGIFFKKEDGSVWSDLSEYNLDEKLLLRSDGTSVYITQDLGLAIQRHNEFNFDKHIYVVGNEQEYHFQVLSLLLKQMGYSWAEQLYHLSYGMVELPFGKMKSREGTVVDADDLMDEMIDTARKTAQEVGRIKDMEKEERERIVQIIALAALKYFILKVDPRKNMLFNPEESIDFNGNTGPSIQYSYARIQSVLRKASAQELEVPEKIDHPGTLSEQERNLIKDMHQFESVINEAAVNQNPSHVANYVYNLAKMFNQFYRDHSILNAETQAQKYFRLVLASAIGKTLAEGFSLLGIDMPEIM